MAISEPVEILKNVGLKVTKNREQVISILQNSARPLNHQEIMEKLPKGQSWDRVTIYRALSDLEGKNILASMTSADRVTYFEIQQAFSDRKQHGHVVCDECGLIECVEDLENQFPKKINGFQVSSMEVTFHGLCRGCQSRPKISLDGAISK
jgi:Fur family ferric uptake transcriptional regulator